jgi:hypothetical protein
LPGSTLRKSRGDSDAPPAMAPPEAVPEADSDDLITLVKLVLSRMDDDEAASFAAQLATLLADLRRTLQPPNTPDRGGEMAENHIALGRNGTDGRPQRGRCTAGHRVSNADNRRASTALVGGTIPAI